MGVSFRAHVPAVGRGRVLGSGFFPSSHNIILTSILHFDIFHLLPHCTFAMKIHQRLYAVRPLRARSKSLSSSPTASSSRTLHTLGPLSFFDSPPSRPSSSNLVVSSRLTVEAKAEFESHSTNSPYSQPSQNSSSHSNSHPSGSSGPPYPLAFTSSQSDTTPSHFHPYASHHNFFPYPALGPFPAQDTHPSGWLDSTESTASQLESEHRVEPNRYHLDVGAYGIPKHLARDSRVAAHDSRPSAHQNLLSQALDSAVLVGEDAYFVRDNAMGVADGVGGWARLNKNGMPFLFLQHSENPLFGSWRCNPKCLMLIANPLTARIDGSSPSALFAQRLMTYCSQEVDAAMSE